jgi:hypothetical protein
VRNLGCGGNGKGVRLHANDRIALSYDVEKKLSRQCHVSLSPKITYHDTSLTMSHTTLPSPRLHPGPIRVRIDGGSCGPHRCEEDTGGLPSVTMTHRRQPVVTVHTCLLRCHRNSISRKPPPHSSLNRASPTISALEGCHFAAGPWTARLSLLDA